MLRPTDLELAQFQSLLDTRHRDGKTYIFDPCNKVERLLQPEELVRQLFVQYLLHIGFRKNLLRTEYTIQVLTHTKRCDIVIFDKEIRPLVLVECKAPSVSITQETFNQASRYNLTLQVAHFAITNGIHTYFCRVNHATQSFEYINSLTDLLLFQES